MVTTRDISSGITGPIVVAGATTRPFQHNPTFDADAGNFNLVAQVFADVNLPDTRDNVVWGLGYNIGAGGGRDNAAEPMLGIKWESYWVPGGVGDPSTEFHISSVGTTTGTERRHYSFITPRDGVLTSVAAMNAGQLNFQTDAAVQKIQFDLANNAAYVFGSMAINFRVNNTPVLAQRNVADAAYINLPFIDADDRLKISQGLIAVANTPTTGSHANRFALLEASTLAVNGTLLYGQLPSGIAGNVSAFTFTGGATGNITGAIYNGDTGSGAHARLEIRTGGTSAGDPHVIFNVNGGLAWSVGADNSDSDKFKICRTSLIGTNNALVIDPSNNLDVVIGANNQSFGLYHLTELTTIAAAAFTDTTIQIPIGARVKGVSTRVTVAIPTATAFDVGVSGATTRYATGVLVAANTTDRGMLDGATYYAAAVSVRITPNGTPADTTGRVRVTIHYEIITPPTS